MNKISQKALTLAGLAFTLACMPACRATNLSAVKKDPAYDPKVMQRVFVAAVMKTDRGQKMLEDEFVRQLKSRGREAVAANTLVARGAKVDPETWKSLIRANHCDTVIVSRLLDMKVEEEEYGAKVNYPHYDGSGYAYYGLSYAAIYQPQSYVREQTAVIETKVFDVAGDREVWSAHSTTEITWGGDPVPQVRKFVQTLFKAARR